MFKYDLINKLAILLVKKEHENKISFISNAIIIISFLSFFYFIQTEARNFTLYLSLCSSIFYFLILVVGGAWWDEIQHNINFIPAFLRRKNNTYYNQYVSYIIFTNVSLLISYILIWFLQKLLEIDTNFLIAQDLILIFYALTMISLLVAMSRLTFERSIVIFLDNSEYTVDGENRFYVSEKSDNKTPKQTYEENKDILKKSFKIKTALWSLITVSMIVVAITNINLEALNIYNYPYFQTPNFSWELWDLIKFFVCYFVILGGWFLSLTVVYVAFKTLMQD